MRYYEPARVERILEQILAEPSLARVSCYFATFMTVPSL